MPARIQEILDRIGREHAPWLHRQRALRLVARLTVVLTRARQKSPLNVVRIASLEARRSRVVRAMYRFTKPEG